jgi:hypothetical protein
MGRFSAEGPCIPCSLCSWQGDCRRSVLRSIFPCVGRGKSGGNGTFDTSGFLMAEPPPTLSKVFEKLLPIVENQLTLPDHQFGFRQRHSTIQQATRFTKQSKLNNIALQPFCIYPKHLIKSSTLASCTSYRNLFPLTNFSFSSPT